MDITWAIFLKLKFSTFLTSLLLLILNFKSGGGQLRILEESTDFNGRLDDFNSLRCLVAGPGDKTYKWYHNGTLIDEEYLSKLPAYYCSFKREKLVLCRRPINLRYQGTYQLFVSSSFGRIFCRKMKVIFKGIGTFEHIQLPDIRQVIIGQPFHLRCPKHSYFTGCVYKWGRSGSPFGLKHVKEYSNRVVLPDGSLFFSSIKNKDMLDFGWKNGGRSCIVDCVWPEFHKAFISHEVSLNASKVNISSFGPKIITIIKDMEVLVGTEYVHVTCAASGRLIDRMSDADTKKVIFTSAVTIATKKRFPNVKYMTLT